MAAVAGAAKGGGLGGNPLLILANIINTIWLRLIPVRLPFYLSGPSNYGLERKGGGRGHEPENKQQQQKLIAISAKKYYRLGIIA